MSHELEDETMSYNDWLENGRQVRAGETAVDFDEDGNAVFDFDQTVASSAPSGIDADGNPYWEDED